jgi:hypothetical protein
MHENAGFPLLYLDFFYHASNPNHRVWSDNRVQICSRNNKSAKPGGT